MSLVYRHVGCTTPVLRSTAKGGALIGAGAPASRDWEIADGQGGWIPAVHGALFPLCPDCGKRVPPHPLDIARVEETMRGPT